MKCIACHTDKPEHDFYRWINGKLFRKCRTCFNAAQTARRRGEQSQVEMLYYAGFVPEAQRFYLRKAQQEGQ